MAPRAEFFSAGVLFISRRKVTPSINEAGYTSKSLTSCACLSMNSRSCGTLSFIEGLVLERVLFKASGRATHLVFTDPVMVADTATDQEPGSLLVFFQVRPVVGGFAGFPVEIIWVKSAPHDFWDNNFVPLGQELCPK